MKYVENAMWKPQCAYVTIYEKSFRPERYQTGYMKSKPDKPQLSNSHHLISTGWIQAGSKIIANELQPIEAERFIYALVNCAIFGSDGGLFMFWCHAINRANAGLLSVGPLETNFS